MCHLRLRRRIIFLFVCILMLCDCSDAEMLLVRFHEKGEEMAVGSNFLTKEFKLDVFCQKTAIKNNRKHGVVSKSDLFALTQTFVKT